MAAVIATRLVKFVKSAIHCQSDVPSSHIHMWTDSKIVLHWLYKSRTHSTPFISQRITEIIGAFPAGLWSFTPSGDNPADLLTRGIPAQQLFSSELWLHRSSWLLSKQHWLQWIQTNVLLQLVEEGDADYENLATQSTDGNAIGIHNVVNNTHYSSIGKLVAVTTCLLRYVNNSHEQKPHLNDPLTATELNSARKLEIFSSLFN